MSVALYLKDPAAARYAAGGLAEAEELFGSPLPDLPAPELDEGREYRDALEQMAKELES